MADLATGRLLHVGLLLMIHYQMLLAVFVKLVVGSASNVLIILTSINWLNDSMRPLAIYSTVWLTMSL